MLLCEFLVAISAQVTSSMSITSDDERGQHRKFAAESHSSGQWSFLRHKKKSMREDDGLLKRETFIGLLYFKIFFFRRFLKSLPSQGGEGLDLPYVGRPV